MGNRVVALAAAAVIVAGIAGCSTPPPALGSSTAHVTINGKEAGPKHAVDCTQTGRLWSIETLEEKPGFTAYFQAGEELSADAVEIRDLTGFTGSYWKGTVGEAEASIVNNTYVINGTASGSFADKPNAEVSVSFKIQVSC